MDKIKVVLVRLYALVLIIYWIISVTPIWVFTGEEHSERLNIYWRKLYDKVRKS